MCFDLNNLEEICEALFADIAKVKGGHWVKNAEIGAEILILFPLIYSLHRLKPNT